jgi:hypothetical protein
MSVKAYEEIPLVSNNEEYTTIHSPIEYFESLISG